MLQQLTERFRRFDGNNDGYLSASELEQALGVKGKEWKFSPTTVAHLLRLFAAENSGNLDCNGFAAMVDYLDRSRLIFDYYGKLNPGELTYKQLRQALTDNGFTAVTAKATAMTAIEAKFDPLQTERIDFPTFIDVMLFFNATSATFTHYDTEKSGCIEVNFHQFLHACASVM